MSNRSYDVGVFFAERSADGNSHHFRQTNQMSGNNRNVLEIKSKANITSSKQYVTLIEKQTLKKIMEQKHGKRKKI